MFEKILVTTTLALACVSFAWGDTITLVADDYQPYNGKPGEVRPGFAIEVAKAVFEPKGHVVKYLNVPWARALTAVAEGTYDAAIGAYDGDVEGGIIPKEPMGVDTNCFFVKKGSAWKYAGIESVKSIQLGVIKDYSYDQGLFDAYVLKGVNIQSLGGDAALETNLKKLAAGRIDAFIDMKNVVLYYAGKLKLADQIVQAGSLGEGKKMYIAFSPKRPKSKEYATLYDAGVKELRASGKLKSILSAYGITDWVK